jgi:hypothetical protein
MLVSYTANTAVIPAVGISRRRRQVIAIAAVHLGARLDLLGYEPAEQLITSANRCITGSVVILAKPDNKILEFNYNQCPSATYIEANLPMTGPQMALL